MRVFKRIERGSEIWNAERAYSIVESGVQLGPGPAARDGFKATLAEREGEKEVGFKAYSFLVPFRQGQLIQIERAMAEQVGVIPLMVSSIRGPSRC